MPTWETLFHFEEFQWKEPHEQVVRFTGQFPTVPGTRLLDLGCGGGRHTVYLASRGFDVVGLDNAPTALRLTRSWLEREGCPARLLLADMTALPLPSGYFDGLLSIFVLYHNPLSGIRTSLAEIYRLLKPGGRAVVSFASERSYRFGMGRQIEPNTFIAEGGPDGGEVHHFFDEESLRAELAAFHIQRIELCEEQEEQGKRHSHYQAWFEKPGDTLSA